MLFWLQTTEMVSTFQSGDKHDKKNELAHEIMALFVLRKLILQTRAHAQPSSVARCLIFGRTLRLIPFLMCANSEGSGFGWCWSPM